MTYVCLNTEQDERVTKARFRRARAYRLNGRDLDLAKADLSLIMECNDEGIRREASALDEALASASKRESLLCQRIFSTQKNEKWYPGAFKCVLADEYCITE